MDVLEFIVTRMLEALLCIICAGVPAYLGLLLAFWLNTLQFVELSLFMQPLFVLGWIGVVIMLIGSIIIGIFLIGMFFDSF